MTYPFVWPYHLTDKSIQWVTGTITIVKTMPSAVQPTRWWGLSCFFTKKRARDIITIIKVLQPSMTAAIARSNWPTAKHLHHDQTDIHIYHYYLLHCSIQKRAVASHAPFSFLMAKRADHFGIKSWMTTDVYTKYTWDVRWEFGPGQSFLCKLSRNKAYIHIQSYI